MPSPENFYATWRARIITATLRESGTDAPPERLLQAVWQHQRLRRDALATLDGRAVRILHPGFKNVEAGPDFRGAVIQFGDERPRSGDVEIDLRAAGWRDHGHDRNANFRNVILHVVWEQPPGVPVAAGLGRLKAELPTLNLRGLLDAPLAELEAWLGGEAPGTLPENFRGRCAAPLRDLPPERVAELLRQAAQVRLEHKAAAFAARARATGWEQALWEGLFRALGYKQNAWPLQRLAELRGRLVGKNLSAPAWQARLLGVAGLLPAEPAPPDKYFRQLWDQWWRERDEFGDVILPRALWKFSGVRPANHPQRRLALAAHWLAAGDLPARLERWCAAAAATPESLLEILQVERDEFWSWHWTLQSARLAQSQPLLGAARATDLAVNVILPWLWARADAGRNEKLRGEIARRFFAWPAAEDNAALKLARQRLLGGGGKKLLASAAAQQGLLQIVRDFCEHSNAACEACRFPDLVRAWQQ